MWEVVPESEQAKISEALKNGCCVSCYEPIASNADERLYCHECDPPEGDDDD